MRQNLKTPTKADNKLEAIINQLNIEWGLGLPIGDGEVQWSPSRGEKTDKFKILLSIRYLYYKDKKALDYSLACFNEQAVVIFTNWKFKPRADFDVIPSRVSSKNALPKASFLKTRDLDEKAVPEVTAKLLHILSTVAESVKTGKDYATNKETHGVIPQVPGAISAGGGARQSIGMMDETMVPKSKSSKALRQSTLSGYVFGTKKTTVKPDPPSSDEYKCDQDTTTILEEVDFASTSPFNNAQTGEVSRPTVKPEYPRRSTESFKTAPSTPFLSYADNRELETNTSKYDSAIGLGEPLAQNANIVTSGLRNAPRKRSRPEHVAKATSRKVSREGRMRQVSGSRNSSFQANSVSNAARSFESTTSVTASMASNSTTQTTPNTSFTTDTMATSFNSNVDSFSKASISFTTDICSAFQAKLGNSNACQVTSDAMDIDPDSIGRSPTGYRGHNDAKVVDKLMGPPTSLGRPNAGGCKAPVCESADCERTKIIDNAEQNVSGKSTTIERLNKALSSDSPFAYLASDTTLSFRQVYEINRVAKHCNISVENLFSTVRATIDDDYGKFWSLLVSQVPKGKKSLPEKSSVEAWVQAGLDSNRVSLSGKLSFLDRSQGPLFDFRLGPLKLDSSYRLSRKFGGDRFLTIDVPGVTPDSLPSHLRQDASTAREVLIRWLVKREHPFLGRFWRAFYIKPIDMRGERGKQSSINTSRHRVYLFAMNGHGFQPENQCGERDPRSSSHVAMPIESLIDWFMPASQNQHQSSLKFFARLQLGVSKTKPTLAFKPGHIIRSGDAFSDSPSIRKLNFKRSDEKKTERDDVKSKISKRSVMNDGCARISKAAAMTIAQKLGLDGHPPCVYQGRIGGAKGMWMIDALGETFTKSDPDHWIEVTDSQLKFEWHSDAMFADPARVTFEVNAWSKPLSQASLNFQLIPILVAQGVQDVVFMRLLEEDLTTKVAELQVAMERGLSLRLWNQENYSTLCERSHTGKIEMLGGLPNSLGEKINWFVEHGFEPKTCLCLKDFLTKAISGYCERLESKLSIGVGRSTFAFMIADPLAVLAEDEVHMGFSTVFRDTKSGFSDTMLHNIDVLVSRSPAHLPSDIQKVRAVFKPELGIYKDVIVFSSRGDMPLAEKLSGGDYDGDRAWVCWEPELVQPFTNAAVPKAPEVERYGIEKDKREVSDFLNTSGRLDVDAFLYHAFDFNMHLNMLGFCTSYYDSLCYKNYPNRDFVHSHDLAYLLGYLVDSAKGGLRFDEQAWRALRSRWKLLPVPKPAYKDPRSARPTMHVIDRLVFETAKGVKDKALKNFADRFQDAGKWDEDLARVWKIEFEDSRRNDGGEESRFLSAVLTDLLERLTSIYNNNWPKNPMNADEDRRSRSDAMTFRAVVEKCRDEFLELQPLDCASHRAKVWKRDGHDGHWGLLKASALFSKYPSGYFVWYVAGVELGEIKARARKRGGYRCVVSDIHEAMKVDRKVVKGSVRREKEEEELEDDDDDDYGSLFDFADLDGLS